MSNTPSPSTLQLLSALLSNTQNHDLHLQAIKARDEALSASLESYGNVCLELARTLLASDGPPPDASFAPHWIPLGQLAGLSLKNALLRPPIVQDRSFSLQPPYVDPVRALLLQALHCQQAALRGVASSVLATSAVSVDAVQPYLALSAWTDLFPTLLRNLQARSAIPGSLLTLRKMFEEDARVIPEEFIDELIPMLIESLAMTTTNHQLEALQILQTIVAAELFPSALVLKFDAYLQALGQLATHADASVRQWVCRSVVTLAQLRTEYLYNSLEPVCQFLLKSTSCASEDPTVALEACEFWLTLATLDECPPVILQALTQLLPQLVPVLLHNMVYSEEQRAELMIENEEDPNETALAPIFHKSRAQPTDDDSDDDEDDDDDDMEWTLRKCSAGSLDALANLMGDAILPHVLPSLQERLASPDPWIQEAAILVLGAIAEGCQESMYQHMAQLMPYLLDLLSKATLPQLTSIVAWTIGRYAPWAVEQVQNGSQGHLLAQMTELFLIRLRNRHRRVQVAVCSAFGTVMEAAGDLMTPYMEHVFRALVEAMSRYKGRSLLLLFDLLGVMADYCGAAIAEGELPSIYVPPLLHIWNEIARHNPSDKSLLPLMESLASIAMVSGSNYQPYALESFDNAMAIIEAVQLTLIGSGDQVNEDEADPIVCAVDLLDGLVEGLTDSFPALVRSSHRYGPHFLTVLLTLCKHDITAVRMSVLALVGDLAKSCPTVLEPALTEIIGEAVDNMNPMQPSLCTNAVWSMGEICVRCRENPAILEPFAEPLLERLIPLLVGNGTGNGDRGVHLPGLTENAAACLGRLGQVHPPLVSRRLSVVLLGWCDGLAKVCDPTERADGFRGLIQVIYANPQAVAEGNATEAIAAILFAIVSWHMAPEAEWNDTLQPFPASEAALGQALQQLVRDLRSSVDADVWHRIEKHLPVNVRQLLREAYP